MATQEQKEQAIKCLKLLQAQGMDESVLRSYLEDETVFYSERQQLNGEVLIGTLYWVTNDTAESENGKKFADVISKFEEEHNSLVYHATHEHTEFGELLDLFYVSKYDEEWEDDLRDLKENRTCAYVANLTDPLCSEFGYIIFDLKLGGVVRTA